MIGDTVKTTLFPGDSSPLNGTLRIEGIEFTVIGVQEKTRLCIWARPG